MNSNKGKCSYIRPFLAVCSDFLNLFKKLTIFPSFIQSNSQIYDLEVQTLTTFIVEIYDSLKLNDSLKIENIILNEYFNASSFMQLDLEFEEILIKDDISQIQSIENNIFTESSNEL